MGNPDDGMLADFIPANVPPLARATQFFAILSYCIFADESVKDVVTAVETFPKFNKAKPDDKVRCMVFSCTLRFIQGMVSLKSSVSIVYYVIRLYIISLISIRCTERYVFFSKFNLFCSIFAFLSKLACLVVLLLVINTTDVVEIVLNFTAVNFVSAFDDVGKKTCLEASCEI